MKEANVLRRLRLMCVIFAGILVVTGFALPGSTGASSARPSGRNGGSGGALQHIIIMVKENRSFDTMFGAFPGANGATTFTGVDGQQHPLNHTPIQVGDIGHTYQAYKRANDHGRLDGFALNKDAIQHGLDVADSQFQQSDIPGYWAYAQQYALADNFFSTIAGPSMPNHLFTIAGENGNIVENPRGSQWGCDAPPGTKVAAILPDGQTKHVAPCFDFQTLGDLLDAAGVSWRYYAPQPGQSGYVWSTYDAIQHIRYGSDWTNNVADYTQFARDAASGNLPAVSWFVQPQIDSDHPPSNVCDSENFTVSQLNAVMDNPTLWASTAIILVWDDWGGFYDHVNPPVGKDNPYIEYGSRVPAIVMSPYVKGSYVDHTIYSFPSILRFVEDNWSLPSLTDLDANANSLMDAFDFSQQPLAPLPLSLQSCSRQ